LSYQNDSVPLRAYLLLLFFLTAGHLAHAQLMYRTRYSHALVVESYGISPNISVNYENAFLRFKSSFVAARAGVGYTFGGILSDNTGGLSFPMGLTLNKTANNFRRKMTNRVLNKCQAAPPKLATETFFEFGLGYTYVHYPSSIDRNYLWGIVGLRQQLVIDIPPKPRVLFLKVHLTPQYYQGQIDFINLRLGGGGGIRAGISVGTSL
jgi:hypothetical protein